MDQVLLDLLAALETAAAIIVEIDRKAQHMRSDHPPSAVALDRLVQPWRAAFISSPGHPSVLDGYRVQMATRRATL